MVKLSATHDPITDEPKLSAINSQGQIVTAKTDTAYKTNLENTDEIRPGVSKFFDAQKVRTNFPLLVFFIFLQMLLVCMVYGPIAAFLVEAFPAKVRYTSFSLPYHLGNGVFGGLLPLIGLYVNSATKSMYWGLAYPDHRRLHHLRRGHDRPQGDPQRPHLGRAGGGPGRAASTRRGHADPRRRRQLATRPAQTGIRVPPRRPPPRGPGMAAAYDFPQ